MRFRTYAFHAVPFDEMASALSQQSVAFFLQACAAIVARAAWPRSSQIAGAVDVHTTLEWIGATQGWKDLDFFVESKARVVESLVQVLRHVSGGLVRQRAWCRPCNSDEGKRVREAVGIGLKMLRVLLDFCSAIGVTDPAGA